MYRENGKSYLANVLRKLRLTAGFTQKNMADALNISRSTYTYYEMGKTTPDIQSLQLMANIFNVGIDIFLPDSNSDLFLEDTAKQRPAKRVTTDPQHVGELSHQEKNLIALLRVLGPNRIDEIIEVLTEENRTDI